MAKALAPGRLAPAIALPDQEGALQKLADRRGKWTLVYFYPKDDTPGCTAEACGIRSADSPARHKKFAAKYELPFTLLADEKKSVVRA